MWTASSRPTSYWLSCTVVMLTLGLIHGNPVPRAEEGGLELIILHNNDMHARFEQTNVDSGVCTKDLADANKCYGGFARVAHEVRKYRNEAKSGGLPVLYLNAGDTYTGTPWFTVFKDNITAAFLNILQPDAISLGNHEFDEYVEGLVPFLNEVDFPVLAANLDLRKVPELASTKSLRNSTVLEVQGIRIGVIGYLTPETKITSNPNDVEYYEEIDSINAEAQKLKETGINIIIALGHSGYHKDQIIAEKCPDVDLVIGGHSHSFLYTGSPPDAEKPEGPYPTNITQPSGKVVPVVQSYAYTKYLGKLHVQFDAQGNLIEFDGTPILLNNDVPREADVLQLLEVYRPNITALENDIVGHSKVRLEGRSEFCRKAECNLGNLIADSMIYARVLEEQGGLYWTDAAIAFVNGGGIRSSIEKRNDGTVLSVDVLTVLPFNNSMYVTKITGDTLWNALEHSAAMTNTDSDGGFLQMSGIYTKYDYNKEIGNRVVSALVRCAECNVPTYEPLNKTKIYSVVVTEFLLNGGDGHKFMEDNAEKPTAMKKSDYDTLVQYLNKHDYVYPGLEERITIIQRENEGDGDGDGGNGDEDDGAYTIASSIILVIASISMLFAL